MNQLPLRKRIEITHHLVEGMSMRATARVLDVSVDAVMKLLVDAGKACWNFHDRTVRGIKARRVECDEQWSFCYAKKKNVSYEQRQALGHGDAWLWVSMDADTKLVINWLIGQRSYEYAEMFVEDLASRLDSKTQLTTDGYVVYIDAVKKIFGGIIDYAMLHKIYHKSHYIGADKKVIIGNPDIDNVTTAHIERNNLNMRMGNRRFTRDTNAFSKKLENHKYSVALYYTYYNFARIHTTLRVTPAMETGISDHVWSIEELVDLIPTVVPQKRGPYKKRT
jgi:IS1 family transposase